MKEVNELLKIAVAKGASDLHIKVGSPPIMRVHGRLVPLSEDERVAYDDTVKAGNVVLNPAQRDAFKKTKDLDFSYSVPGLGRFRCNIFVQRGAIGLVFRLIPTKLPSIVELGLPEVLTKLALEERGLILVTGTTGSGKSTTLAAMIDHINMTRHANIVTIEDPIEFLHRDKRGLINQREIGTDTGSFAVALRASLRQDPDVILVGEMRDLETIETAITAAETGHLVMSTLHTIDATETVNRIIGIFPPYQQSQIRVQLASVLKGVISMRLLPAASGTSRVPATEVLLTTSLIRECIIDDKKTQLIRDYIEQGKLHYGMQTFDQSILELFKARQVTFEEALKWATNAEDFKLKVKGVSSTSDMSTETESEMPDITSGAEDIQIDRFQK
jgi:twitching motility protein PilT